MDTIERVIEEMVVFPVREDFQRALEHGTVSNDTEIKLVRQLLSDLSYYVMHHDEARPLRGLLYGDVFVFLVYALLQGQRNVYELQQLVRQTIQMVTTEVTIAQERIVALPA